MKKKMLALLLALTMALTMLPATAMADDNVASVTFGGVTTEYATINDAWTAATNIATSAGNKATVTLLKDCSAGSMALINSDDYLVFDTNGKTLTFSGSIRIISNGGSLEIVGGGTVTGPCADTRFATLCLNGGTVTVDGATIANTDTSNGNVVYVGGGEFHFKSGSLVAASKYAINMFSGNAYLYSGTIEGNCNGAIIGGGSGIHVAHSASPLVIINRGKAHISTPNVDVVDGYVMDIAYGNNVDGSGTTTCVDQTNLNSVNVSKYLKIQTKAKAVAYAVTFNNNGATGPVSTQAATAEGGTFTLPSASGLYKKGYIFDGWNDGTATYAAGATYTMPANAVTFIAQWKAIPTFETTLDSTNFDGSLIIFATYYSDGEMASGKTITSGFGIRSFSIPEGGRALLLTDKEFTVAVSGATAAPIVNNDEGHICEITSPTGAVTIVINPEVPTYDIILDKTNFDGERIFFCTYNSNGGYLEDSDSALTMPQDGSVRVFGSEEFTVKADGATVGPMLTAGPDEGYYYEITNFTGDTTIVVNPGEDTPADGEDDGSDNTTTGTDAPAAAPGRTNPSTGVKFGCPCR